MKFAKSQGVPPSAGLGASTAADESKGKQSYKCPRSIRRREEYSD